MAAVLAESPAGVASSATGRVEGGYITEDGAEHRVRLDEAWLVPLERALPVRRFGARKGQRHLSGLWWSATTGGHVGFESWLETRSCAASGFRPVPSASRRSRCGCTGPTKGGLASAEPRWPTKYIEYRP